jgi:hypothetical protein
MKSFDLTTPIALEILSCYARNPVKTDILLGDILDAINAGRNIEGSFRRQFAL